MRAERRGLLTNVLNPKAGLSVMAFLPPLADPALGPIRQRIVPLGGVFTFFSLPMTLGLGALAGHFGDRLRAHVGYLNKLTALLFGGQVARLFLTEGDGNV
jgi:threonine/homoserine/homoserine lactone efflux protein